MTRNSDIPFRGYIYYGYPMVIMGGSFLMFKPELLLEIITSIIAFWVWASLRKNYVLRPNLQKKYLLKSIFNLGFIPICYIFDDIFYPGFYPIKVGYAASLMISLAVTLNQLKLIYILFFSDYDTSMAILFERKYAPVDIVFYGFGALLMLNEIIPLYMDFLKIFHVIIELAVPLFMIFYCGMMARWTDELTVRKALISFIGYTLMFVVSYILFIGFSVTRLKWIFYLSWIAQISGFLILKIAFINTFLKIGRKERI